MVRYFCLIILYLFLGNSCSVFGNAGDSISINYPLTVLDKKTGLAVKGVELVCTLGCKNKTISRITDSNGETKIPVYPNCDYTLEIISDDYFPQSIEWHSKKSEKADLIGIYLSKIPRKLKTEVFDIYFDFDQSEIRESELFFLNVAIDQFNKHPNSILQLASYTDCWGDLEYNKRLSARRTQIVRDYIVKQIGTTLKSIDNVPYDECKSTHECSNEQGITERIIQANQHCRRTSYKLIDEDGNVILESSQRVDSLLPLREYYKENFENKKKLESNQSKLIISDQERKANLKKALQNNLVVIIDTMKVGERSIPKVSLNAKDILSNDGNEKLLNMYKRVSLKMDVTEIETEPFSIGQTIKANLADPKDFEGNSKNRNFVVESVGNYKQKLEKQNNFEVVWKWNVHPQKSGNHELDINITAEVNGQELPTDIIPIDVFVERKGKPLWPFLLGGGILIVLGLLVFFLVRSKPSNKAKRIEYLDTENCEKAKDMVESDKILMAIEFLANETKNISTELDTDLSVKKRDFKASKKLVDLDLDHDALKIHNSKVNKISLSLLNIISELEQSYNSLNKKAN